MSYKRSELAPIPIKVTPRSSFGGQLAAIWATEAYGKALGVHLWDTLVSRALSNKAEVDMAIQGRMSDTGEDYETAFKALVIESGMYKLAADSSNDFLEMDADLIQSIREAASANGESPAAYLKRSLNL